MKRVMTRSFHHRDGALLGGGTVNNPNVQPYKYGTKELDRQNGLDWYDSHARMYDPVLGRTPTMDPLAEKYYSISPYAWCAGNPIRYVDPTGSIVEVTQIDVQEAIRLTINAVDRKYVSFNNQGSINRELLLSHKSFSGNYNKLVELEMAPELIKVLETDSYNYKDECGDIDTGHLMVAKGLDTPSLSVEDASDNTTGEVGNTGKTLLPDDGVGRKVSSLNGVIYVLLAKGLSIEGLAENYSHEANGHALMYVRTHDRDASRHQVNQNWIDENTELLQLIFQSLRETFFNRRQ